MRSGNSIDRRRFLVTATAVSGGFAMGFTFSRSSALDEPPEINAWIVIRPDDSVVIRLARSEMGQGVITALPMLVAEELECEWARVGVELVSAHENIRRRRVWGSMSTNASRSVSASQYYLRRAGATARTMLIGAAAARWKVAPSECFAAEGRVVHRPSGLTLRFGELARDAAAIPPPSEVTLKQPKDWKLIGTPQKHLDARDKISGSAIYGIDVRLPNMLHAAIVQCPVFGGALASVDENKILGMSGIRRVVKLSNAAVVVADSWWQAKRGVDALPVNWTFGDGANVTSASIAERLRVALNSDSAEVGRRSGDFEAALTHATTRIEADYGVPFLAHATMEPQNCTADVRQDGVEIWVPTQDPETALGVAANAAGVPREKVVVHQTALGGGFGRRAMIQEYVTQAVLVAKEIGQPIKLVWTREEDVTHGIFRPIAIARLTAGLDASGSPIAWRIRLAAPSIAASIFPQSRGISDKSVFIGLLDETAYAVPNVLLEHVLCPTHVPIGPWRSVQHSPNAFFRESFIDELAHASGRDPYLYRREFLHPKYRAVLDAVANRANWGEPAPHGVFRGIAIHGASNSVCAQVAEVSVDPEGKLKVHRIISAIDAGYVVNPLTVNLQTESAVAYALSATLYGEITIRNGAVEQTNFHDYPMLRLDEMPAVETIILRNSDASGQASAEDAWGGIGEPPVAPVAPAVCNAIFAATGQRIRSLPLKSANLRPSENSR